MNLLKKTSLYTGIIVLFAACNETTEPLTSKGLNSLIKTETETTGANCSQGGLKVLTGLDINSNNELESDEVTSTDYICNGDTNNLENNTRSLIKVSNLSDESECAEGGIRVDTGTDTNSNGILDEAEISVTEYVCNGANGIDYSGEITDGKNSLIEVTEIDSGDDCTYGGLKIEVGIDTDGNNVLNTDEITNIKFICKTEGVSLPGGVFTGSIVISGDLDLITYKNLEIKEITGDLILENINSLEALEGLTKIGGNFILEDCAYATSLTALNGLTSIGGDLEISSCSSLTSLTGLNGLTSIEGSLMIYKCTSLTSLTALSNVTSSIKRLMIDKCTSLTSLDGLENITSIDGDIYSNDGIHLGGNTVLTDYCALNNVVINSEYFSTGLNGYNPSLEAIQSGSCSQDIE